MTNDLYAPIISPTVWDVILRPEVNPAPISGAFVGAIPRDCRFLSGVLSAGASPAPTIGDIVGAYKSLVANDCLNVFKKSIESGVTSVYETMGKLWQRNYHEHIIRNEESYQKIAEYIVNNPAKWREDTFFTNK